MGSPYAHQTGFLYGMLMPVMLGTTAVALDAWSAAEAVPMIEREGATFSMGSTPFLSDIVNLPKFFASVLAAHCERGCARARRSRACWCNAPKPRWTSTSCRAGA